MTTPQDIRPWAPSRNSFVASLLSDEIANESHSHDNLTLEDLHTRTDLLAETVTPVWNTNSGRSDVEISDQVMALLESLQDSPNRAEAIRLYQILFTDYFTHYGTWGRLNEKWQHSDLAESDFIFGLFMDWLLHAPDHEPVDAALFFLARTKKAPPMEFLLDLGIHPRMAVAVAALVARRFNADEDAIIRLASMHKYGARETILSFLRTVDRPENKDWLLTVGYDSGADYHPCGYYAAVHGDLLERLQEPSIDQERLVHYGKILGDMCQAWGGSSSWRSIEDYAEAPQAIGLFFDHVRTSNACRAMAAELRDILYYLNQAVEDADEDPDGDDRPPFDVDLLKQLHAEGRALFARPDFTEEETLKFLWWERPDPTIEDLRAEGPPKFHDVLELAKTSSDNQALEQVVAWAIDYLELNSGEAAQRERQQALLDERMPGICTGGLAGVTDPNLGSVYGQILLQMAQALKGRAPMGAELLIAGLRTDYPHLPEVAAEVLREWPANSIPPEAKRLL